MGENNISPKLLGQLRNMKLRGSSDKISKFENLRKRAKIQLEMFKGAKV